MFAVFDPPQLGGRCSIEVKGRNTSRSASPDSTHIGGGSLKMQIIIIMENYQILGRIGEGAHGIVLKAKHIQVKKTKLIKAQGEMLVCHFCRLVSWLL